MGRKNKKILYWLAGVVAAISGFFAYGELSPDNSSNISGYTYEADTLAVHYIDVGNADCILLQYNENTMIIDTGEKETANEVNKYLTAQGIEQINTMILTHPDADHIGGAKDIMDYMGVSGTIYMTDYQKDSSIYKKLMKNIKQTRNNLVYPKPGDTFTFGPCKIEFFGPTVYIDDANSMSLVCKLTYEDTSFLFTGDCTKEEEREILKKFNKNELSADVLKVGHHGSKGSTTNNFLKAVTPTYGIISCDFENDYGHPNVETLERLAKAKVRTYRTDEDGTIVVSSDGENIKIYTTNSSDKEADTK